MKNKWIVKVMVVFDSHLAHIITIGMSISIGVLYTEIRSEFQVSQSEASWTASIFNGMLGILGIPLGVIVPKIGERWTTLVGTVLLCAGMITSSMVPRYYLLYLTYGITAGAGSGIVHYCASVIPLSHFDTKWRPFAIKLANSGTAVSALVMPPFMVACINAYSWRTTFVVLGCISTIGLLCSALFVKPGEHVLSQPTACGRKSDNDINETGGDKEINKKGNLSLRQSIAQILRNAELMIYFTSTVLAFPVVYGPATFLPDLMHESAIVDYQVAWCIIGMGVGNLCGRILSGIVASKFYEHMQLIHGLTLLGFAASTFALAFANNLSTFMALSILLGLFNGGYFGLLLATLAHYVPLEHAVVSFGLVETATGIASIAGMPLAGFVSDHYRSERGSFIFNGCVMLLASIILCLTKVKTRRVHSDIGNVTHSIGHERETYNNTSI